jgi:hypothetical protein
MTIVGGSGVRLRRRKPHRLIGEGTVTAPQGVSPGGVSHPNKERRYESVCFIL